MVADASARFPDDPGLVLLSARTALREGRVEQSVELLLPLASRHDDFAAAALGWLATAELSRGQPRRAVGAAKRALALDPEQPVAMRALALALAKLEDPSAAAWAERSQRLSSP